MGNLLLEQEAARADEIKKRRKKQVQYNKKGRKIHNRLNKTIRALLIIASLIISLLLIIYIPPRFYKSQDALSYTPLAADASALKSASQLLKESPNEDFDSDGILNAMEEQYKSNPYRIDSDFDGLCEFAEINITKTNPVAFNDDLAKAVIKEDEKNGFSIGTPYKIDDIIFWPDDYTAKAQGGVVRTLNGIRFCFYKGWVKFPQKVYAYAYKNGVHRLLTHKEEEDAWYISGNYEVRCYENPLSFVHQLSLPIAKDIFLDDSKTADFLSNILPDTGGPVMCRKLAKIDLENDARSDVTVPIVYPYVDKSDLSRFERNQNSLKDYTYVIKHIDAGYCVSVSLYSPKTGESIGVIYGYTNDGDLLVADPITLKPSGKIEIIEYAMRMMGQDGNIGQYTWFEWKGLGFSSINNDDRISFLGVDSSMKRNDEDLPEGEPESEFPAPAVKRADFSKEETEMNASSEKETKPIARTISETESEDESEILPDSGGAFIETESMYRNIFSRDVAASDSSHNTVSHNDTLPIEENNTASSEDSDSVITFSLE